MEKTMYRWSEVFDGGICGAYFESFEACQADAIAHVKEIRWTKKEMDKAIKNGENLVIIDKCVLDEDGDEVSFEETG